jgi:hypothetical protein
MSSHLSKLASLSATGAGATSAPASAQNRKAALRAAWMAHTVKRALAAVGSASDADYGAFGWERGDLMVRLQWLRDDIEWRTAKRRMPTVVMLARTSTYPNQRT